MFGFRDVFHFTVSPPLLFRLSMVEKLEKRQNNDDDIDRVDGSADIETAMSCWSIKIRKFFHLTLEKKKTLISLNFKSLSLAHSAQLHNTC